MNESNPPLPPLSKLVAFLAIPFFGFLLFLEVALRTAGFQPLTLAPQAFLWQADRKLGWRNIPGVRFRNEKLAEPFEITTDSGGFRTGTAWSAEGTSPVVVFLGDSTTFCAEVADDQTIASEVARLLGPAPEVRVLNAGVRGFSGLQASLLLDEILERFPTTAIVVYTFTENDPEENLNPLAYAPAVAPVLRLGSGEEPRVVPPPRLPVPHGTPLRHARGSFTYLTQGVRRFSVLAEFVIHRVNIVRARLRARRPSAPSKSPGEGERLGQFSKGMEFVLRRMKEQTGRRGISLIATGFQNGATPSTPRPFLDQPHFAALCEDLGVEYVPLSEHFVGPTTAYLSKLRDGSWDPHYGPAGTRRYAAALAPAVRRSLGRRAPPP